MLLRGSLFAFAALLLLSVGVTALDVGTEVSSVTALDVAATAEVSAQAAVATPSASPTPEASVAPSMPPIKARIKGVLDARAEAREDAKARAEDAREKAKERLDEARDRTKERIEDVRDNAKEKMEQLREQRRVDVEAAREREAQLALKVKQLKAKADRNVTERAELDKQVKLHVRAAFDQRIALAQKMGAEGANATLVTEFVAYAESAKSQYANASNNSARKAIVVAFNQRWRQFKQAVTQDLLKAKLVKSVNATRLVLSRLDGVISRLTAAGFNTTALVNASASISARLDSVLLEPDVPHALGRLRQVHAGLRHLRNAIQRTVNREIQEAYREVPVPSVASDSSLSITASIDSSGTAAASASPSTPPTVGSGDAAGSPEPA